MQVPARAATVIAGAGHAGLVMSHHLGQAERDHVVLDRRSTLGGSCRGVTDVPGLYFLGLLWQHTQASATLFGPTLDAPYLLDAMGLATAEPLPDDASAAVAPVG